MAVGLRRVQAHYFEIAGFNWSLLLLEELIVMIIIMVERLKTMYLVALASSPPLEDKDLNTVQDDRL